MPARVHVKDDAPKFQEYGQKYNAQWTPTILELDSDGTEVHRIEGFLENDDFLAQLMLGRAQLDFKQGRFADAGRRFREVVDQLPATDAAPEALYWGGVSRYKDSHDPAALKETARAFGERYQD